MSTSDLQRAHRALAEQAAMDTLVERLTAQFPELPAEEIGRTIRGEYEGVDDSSIATSFRSS